MNNNQNYNGNANGLVNGNANGLVNGNVNGNMGAMRYFTADVAEAAQHKANEDFMSMVDVLCRMKAQIDRLNEYGNEGVSKVAMEEELQEALDNMFGAAGGRRRRPSKKSRKHRKSRRTHRK